MSTSSLRGRDRGTFQLIDLTGATEYHLPFPQARAGKLRFTGTLGQSIDVFAPVATEDHGEEWVVQSVVSGGFTITFRGPSGTGIEVPPNTAVTCFWDGAAMIGLQSISPLVSSSGDQIFNPVITNPQNGDVITFDGSDWMNTPAGGGSLAGAVILLPTSDGRNTIQPSADTICALKLKRFSATHSESMLEVQDENGVILTEINPGGRLQLNDVDAGELTGANGIRVVATTPGRGAGVQFGNADTGSTQVWQAYAKGSTTEFVVGRHQVRDNILFAGGQASVYIPGTNAGTTFPSGSFSLRIDSGEVGFVPLILQGIAAQTADLQEWRDSTSTNVMRVTSGGRLEVGSTAGTARLYVRDDGNPEVVTIESSHTLASVFLKLGDGGQGAALRVYPQAAASAGVTVVETGGLILRGHYWSGAASLPLDGQWRLRIDDTAPTYYLAANVEGVDVLLIRGSDGQIILGAGASIPTVPTEEVILNGSTRLIGQLAISDNVDVALGTGIGTKWGTAATQLQAWWGNTPVARQAITGDTLAERVASIEAILGQKYGLIESSIPTANMLWDFDSSAIPAQADNTSLAAWPDSAPTPHNMASPGAAGIAFKYRNNVTDNINGIPVVQTVDGDQAEIGFPNFSPAIDDASFTHYYVGRYTAGGSSTGILIYGFEADTIRLYLDGDVLGANQVGWEFDVGAGPVDVDIAGATTGVQLITFVFDKTAGNGKVYRNGTQIGTTSTSVGGAGAGAGFDWGQAQRIEFFATAGGTATLVGEHARLIGYNAAHSDTVRLGIEAALKVKYGIV